MQSAGKRACRFYENEMLELKNIKFELPEVKEYQLYSC